MIAQTDQTRILSVQELTEILAEYEAWRRELQEGRASLVTADESRELRCTEGKIMTVYRVATA